MDMIASCLGAAAVASFGLAGLVKVKWPWIYRDMYQGYTITMSRSFLNQLSKKGFISLVDVLENKAELQPDDVCIIFEGKSYTYDQINSEANLYAHQLISLKVERNSTVALFVPSGVFYLIILFACWKCGVKVALINTTLKGQAFVHSVTVANSDVLFIGPTLLHSIKDTLPEFGGKGIRLLLHAESSSLLNVLPFLASIHTQSRSPVSLELRSHVDASSVIAYIYTSGTTGLPKASNITAKRTIAGVALMMAVGMRRSDRIYVCLPLYHSSAFLLGIGASIVLGSSVILREKFSTSNFWSDVVQYKATVFLYIGEVCRFLVHQQPSPLEKQHQIRMIVGNGLRRDVWSVMRDRFRFPLVREFYAATECPVALLNLWNKEGSCGSVTPFISGRLFKILKYNLEEGVLVRNDRGFCIPSESGEPGLLVYRIYQATEFPGYHGNKRATNDKLLFDVMTSGDMYYNTGDLVTFDDEYFVYFSDRLGDTYRWRGENISTNEVANVISSVPGVLDACVYGVEVAGEEGKAGMVALTLADGLDIDAILGAILSTSRSQLQPAAVAVFLRISNQMELTATFKLVKTNFAKQGYNPVKVGSDLLFFLDPGLRKYVPLTQDLYNFLSLNGVRAASNYSKL